MNRIAKFAAGAILVCGAAIPVAAPAQARGVAFSVGVGVPAGPVYGAPYYGYGYGPTCYDYYGPYECGYAPYYGPGYVGPAFVGGYWGGGYGYRGGFAEHRGYDRGGFVGHGGGRGFAGHAGGGAGPRGGGGGHHR